MMRAYKLAIPLAILLNACSDSAPDGPDVDLTRAVPVEQSVLFVDEDAHRGYLLDVTQKEPSTRVLEFVDGDHEMIVRPPASRGQALVLSSGRAAGKDDGEIKDEQRAELVLVDKTGERARYELPGRFAKLTASPDGRFAIAHSPAQSFAIATSVALVDLEKPLSADNPATLSLTSLDGQAPSRFVFSEEQVVAGESRRLLLSLSNNYVNLVDLAHLERGDITVELVLPDDKRVLSPRGVVFAGDRIYVQSDNGQDVLVMQLTKVSTQENRHGFRISLLTLPTGRSVHAIELVGTADTQRLVALTPNRVVVFDPTTAQGSPVTVKNDYDHVIAFRGRSPNDDVERDRLLLTGSGGSIAFLDRTDRGDVLSAGLEEVDTGGAISEVYPLLGQNELVLNHGNERVSLVDLEERTVTPLSLPENASKVLLDEARERLWVSFGGGRVGTVTLGARLSTDEILLDAPAENVLVVEGKHPKVVALHRANSGFVTVFDAQAPSRKNATALLGFFWAQLLD